MKRRIFITGGNGFIGSHIVRELVRRGFVVAQRPGLNVLRLDPALTIEREDITRFLAALEDVLQ